MIRGAAFAEHSVLCGAVAKAKLGPDDAGCYDRHWMTSRGFVVRSASIVVALGIAAASSGSAAAAAQDFRVVDGTLTQSLVLPGPQIAEVSGSDGILYYIDLRLLPGEPAHLPARTAVTVIGYEGERADLIAAHVLKFQSGPPETTYERQPTDLRVIGGTVQSISEHSLTLKSADGTKVTVEIGNLWGSLSSLAQGEHVEVLGVLTDGNMFAANALILKAPNARGERRR